MTSLILLQRLGQRFTGFATGIEEARTMAHHFKVLARLTDAQLADRGLERKKIPQIVEPQHPCVERIGISGSYGHPFWSTSNGLRD
jgi:hypothetical protein